MSTQWSIIFGRTCCDSLTAPPAPAPAPPVEVPVELAAEPPNELPDELPVELAATVVVVAVAEAAVVVLEGRLLGTIAGANAVVVHDYSQW